MSFARVTAGWWADEIPATGETIPYMYQIPPLIHEASGWEVDTPHHSPDMLAKDG